MLPLHRSDLRLCLALLATLLVTGCGTGNSRNESAEDDVVEIEIPDDPESDAATSASTPLAGNRPDEAGGLSRGERFPFVSRLEEELEQQTPQGVLVSRSVLEVRYCVVYEGRSSEGGTTPTFEVRFDQVRFTREIPGQPSILFDSSTPSGTAPVDLQGIAGLAGNGFHYRFSPRRGIQGSEDFGDFLDRCLGVSTGRQEADAETPAPAPDAQPRWGSRVTTETLRDLLGIVWVRTAQIGERWSESRLFLRTLPLRLESDYVLRQHRGDDSGIEWESRALPLNSSGDPEEDRPTLELISGEGSGSAWIDRRTGLPRVLEQSQRLEMWVQTVAGEGFRQVKTSLLTIARDVRNSTPTGSVIQAGFNAPAGDSESGESIAPRATGKPAALPISKPSRSRTRSPTESQRRS